MSFLQKLGIGVGAAQTVRHEVSGPIHLTARARTSGGASPATGATHAPVQLESNRLSNGLKELLWNLNGLERGALLDLGPAWQTTLSFFIERGFRVSSEDVLRAWKTFLGAEEARLKEDFAAGETLEMTPTARAMRFLKENLQYPRSSFDAVLLWDLLDSIARSPMGSSATVWWIPIPCNWFPPRSSVRLSASIRTGKSRISSGVIGR